MNPGFDWAGLMRAGIRHLGLKPGDFWALTPVELMLMLGLEGGSAPMARARLDELARSYPDMSKARDAQGESDV